MLVFITKEKEISMILFSVISCDGGKIGRVSIGPR